MFGYIQTDRPNLFVKDELLYKALYCGICKSTGKNFGLFARAATSYDITFLSAVVHNYLNTDVVLKKKRCILHPIKRRHIAKNDEITDTLSAVNIMLAYYKFWDDVLDEGGFKKRLLKFMLKRGYKKARKKQIGLEEIVKTQYDNLRALEKENCQSIDMVSHCFGEMMRKISIYILKDKSVIEFENMAYGIGKWIYLIDALDDLEKDFKSHSYNPFLALYPNFKDREGFITEHKNEIDFIMGTTINGIQNDFNGIKFHFNRDLVKNIVYLGITSKTKQILGSKCKCKENRSAS